MAKVWSSTSKCSFSWHSVLECKFHDSALTQVIAVAEKESSQLKSEVATLRMQLEDGIHEWKCVFVLKWIFSFSARNIQGSDVAKLMLMCEEAKTRELSQIELTISLNKKARSIYAANYWFLSIYNFQSTAERKWKCNYTIKGGGMYYDYYFGASCFLICCRLPTIFTGIMMLT